MEVSRRGARASGRSLILVFLLFLLSVIEISGFQK